MSLRLEIKKKMVQRSPRVKAIDFHPSNSWVALALYSGTVALNDYASQTCIKTFQTSAFPVRAVRFVPNKHWILAGSDDMKLRVFNYNTMQKVKQFQAHADFIRAILVHPSQPFILTSGDDAKIKIWNYQTNFSLKRTLDQHKHYVLALAFNPKDLTKFGSASMDKTIKLWNFTTDGKANLTLTGHKGSVNALDFYRGDRPHLVSGSDDKTVKIWDYQTKQCLSTIQTHTMAVTSVFFHQELPVLFTTSEDGKSILHHSHSYTTLNILEYNLGMGWAISVSPQDRNIVALGYDQGSVLVKIGSDDPVVSISGGRLIFTRSMQVLATNLKAVDYQNIKDGARIPLSPKQLGSSQIYPTYLKHCPNGHHFGLCNRKQFVVIKTASFKTAVSGSGTNLIWRSDTEFAVLDNDCITYYSNFELSESVKISSPPQRIFQGPLLGSSDANTTSFYIWQNLNKCLLQLPFPAQKLWWDENGENLALSNQTKLCIFKFNKKINTLAQILTIQDKISSGVWVNKIFYYITRAGKIHLTFLGKSFFLTNGEKKQFILGALEQQQRIYLFDRNNNLFSHAVSFEVLDKVYDFVQGNGKQQPKIPDQYRDRVAKIYHGFQLKKQAYKLTENMDHKFQLALQLGLVREAHKIATATQSNSKLRIIGDLSLKKGEIELAIECYQKIDDLNSLLMIYSSLKMEKALKDLAVRAENLTKMNIAYMCYYLTGNSEKCLDILIKSKRYPEAALFARTYLSQKVSECVGLWRQSLTDKSIAQKISDPNQAEQQQYQDEEGQQTEQN